MKTFRTLVVSTLIALSLSGCSSGTSLDQAKDGIRQLFYDYRVACNISTEDCKSFYLAHNYPGYYDYSSSKVKNALSEINSSWTYDDPDLSTVDPDQAWTFPRSCQADPVKLQDGTVPKGETFTFKSGGSYVHATVLDGKWYFYQSLNFC